MIKVNFSDELVVYTDVRGIEWTEEDMSYFICDMLEGAIEYWGTVDRVAQPDMISNKVKGDTFSEFIGAILMSGRKVKLCATDEEDEGTDDEWYLTFEKLKEGLTHYRVSFDSYDSITCDIVCQYAVFGEVVYS